jgi:SAM-dependent methyltransferase
MMLNRTQGTMSKDLDSVKRYWESHLNCTQFLGGNLLNERDIGTDEFFYKIEASFDRYKYKIGYFERLAAECGKGDLLEVGCGLGVELGLLSGLGFKVVGVDLAPAAVTLANEYLRIKELPGHAVVGNAEDLQFESESFDAIYSSGVLHHTPDIERAIAEIYRVLKNGGRILIVLYHRRSWFYLLHRLTGIHIEFEDEDAPIINAYAISEVKDMFARFRNLSITCEYFQPERTHRKGVFPLAFNSILVPLMRVAPVKITRPFGWHLVIQATK